MTNELQKTRSTKVLLVVNGNYGDALLEAAEVVVGGLDVAVVELPCLEEAAGRRAFDKGKIERHCGTGEVLLLTDLLGSTPANVCLGLVAQNPGWEMLTGLNLPMLMKLATCDPRLNAAELARQLCNSSQRCCKLGTDILTEERSAD